MWDSRPREFAADVARVARVVEVDELAVEGYIVAALMTDGRIVVATNGCCTAHAIASLAINAVAQVPALVPCSAEQ